MFTSSLNQSPYKQTNSTDCFKLSQTACLCNIDGATPKHVYQAKRPDKNNSTCVSLTMAHFKKNEKKEKKKVLHS